MRWRGRWGRRTRFGLARQQQRRCALGQRGKRCRDVDQRSTGLGFQLLEHRLVWLQGACGQHLGHAVPELCDALRVDGVDAREVHLLDALARRALYRTQHIALARRYEQDRLALASGASRAPHAVNVGLRVVRHVVIDDMSDSLDVKASRGHVGRHHDVYLSIFEPRDGALAQRLRDIAVQRRSRKAARLQLLGEFHRRLFGAREHQHSIESLGFQDPCQSIELMHAADHPIAVMDVGGGAGLAPDCHFDRRFQVLLRDPANRRGKRCGEQRDLSLWRRLLQDTLDGIDKTHREHFIRFVQHQQLQAAELQRAAVHMIDHAPRRADDHVHTPAQRIQLRLVALAAVNRHHMEAR